jgi:hypothetical protein
MLEGWEQPALERFYKTLPNLGFEVTDILFSGFGCSTDGAMFTYHVNDNILQSFIQQLDCDKKTKAGLQTYSIAQGGGYHNQSSYYNSKCCNHTVYLQAIAPYPDQTVEFVNSYQDQFKKYVIQNYQHQCDKIYSALEQYYNQPQDDQSIQQYLVDNQFEFLQNGQDFSGNCCV